MSVAAPAPKANQGAPAPRYDGRAKVTGEARYASDFSFPDVAYAFLVTSAIARGRIRSMDLAEARAIPGVVEILTHENMRGEVKKTKFLMDGGPASNSVLPLGSPEIAYGGQIIAVVLANTFESAREAAYRVRVEYDSQTPSSTFDDAGTKAQPVAEVSKRHEDPAVGNFDQAFATSPVTVDVHYSTPTQHHNPIELFTTTCVWSGPELTIYEPSQNVYGIRGGVAEQLGMDASRIRVVSPYVGGAFGSKGSLTQRTALIAVAARRLGRPVKLVPTRSQGFTITTYRAETRHHLRLGATRDGRLQALSHDGYEVTSRPDAYSVSGTDASTRMYAAPNIASSVTIVRADRGTPGFMRAPAETPYIYALESAMDELAVALDMDPIELRRVNDTMKEPIKGLPYTSRSVMTCFDQAASAFGWSKRNKTPGSMRDGDWLIGWGCAMACYPTLMAPASARVRLLPDGTARVETAAHEIGNGIYTVVAQVAAEGLGLPLDRITVVLGDTMWPPAPVAGGSITTASVCSVVAQACDAIRAKLTDGTDNHDLVGLLNKKGPGAIEEYAEWVPHGAKPGALQALYRGSAMPVGGARLEDRIQFAFGAELVEVRIQARTKEIKVPRMVGAFAAGRIMNTRTARSQLMGGMIWGIGSALHEETEIDRRAARYVNTNLADYLIPVNADVVNVDVIMVPEEDKLVNPIGVKGIGEIGIVGTAAALANAVFHATGQRIRDLPLRIDDLVAIS